MSAKVQITDRDRGFAAMVARLAKRPSVKVGILSDAPKEPGEGEKPRPYSLLEVAAVHEFGAPSAEPPIPQRSFIRGTVDEKEADIRRLQLVQAQRIVKGEVTGEQAVGQIGARVQGMIQQRIANGIEPPLSDATLERRRNGGSTPLIDTGQLRSSITFEVQKDGA